MSMKRLFERYRRRISTIVPYPSRAMRLSLDFHPFTVLGGTWFDYVNRNLTMSEQSKKDGDTIWWVRLGPFTLAYGRMM
jgi:hypothetical protein